MNMNEISRCYSLPLVLLFVRSSNYLRPLPYTRSAHFKGLYKVSTPECISDNPNLLFISDRHPSIALAVHNEFQKAFHVDVQPDAYHKLCQAGPQRWSRAHCLLVRYNYMTSKGNSLVISGTHLYYENQYLCAWSLQVEPMVVTSWSVLFIIPSQNITKLIGFTRDEDPIVEVNSGQEMVQTLQVYDRPSQQFHNVGIEANGGSFFIGPYKESLILLNGR
ncbi:hypothetical protein Tco_0875816 [Tanacetum coccineum]|uniref:Uncharacterized protein n=1 Tax=Tanacetum coccineum TaxID=301880 RepID=A0ABQ5BQI5_9ASTR